METLMGGVQRVTSPSSLAVGQHLSYVAASATANGGDTTSSSSPVPGCANTSSSSDAGCSSSPDLIRSMMSDPNAFGGEKRDGPPAWYGSTSDDLAATVPRVVSNVMPPSPPDATPAFVTTTASLSFVTTSQSDPSLDGSKHSVAGGVTSSNSIVVGGGAAAAAAAAANSKPSATRRRQSAKANKAGEGGDPSVQRRQKRLERNRESARLSRRRRKQYLEVLETRVTEFSHDMDKGRREHVAKAVVTLQEKRNQILMHPSGTDSDALNKIRVLQTVLSRTSQELMVATTFRSQQLKSFALPPSTKFINWLTLQSDAYFRGGRAASERLSAARIGERILNSGNDKVTPAQSMWPLLCSEIGLSYEQEEKVRGFQRSTLQNHDTWIERHTAFASGKAMESAHDALQAVTLRLGQRERSTLSLLTPEQQMKFLAWSQRNKERLAPVTQGVTVTSFGDAKYQTSELQHPCANLYVLNHRLQSILQRIPRAAPLVTGSTLKKLSRRPSFESLGCYDKEDELLTQEGSFPSSGSLKRSASEMTMDASTSAEDKPSIPPISPPEAQASAAPTVEKVIGHLREIIPPPPTVTTTLSILELPAPTPLSSMSVSQPSLTVYQAHDAPSSGYVDPTAVQQQQHLSHPGAPMSMPMLSVRCESAPVLGAAPPNPLAPSHGRKPSFLPPHLSLVPEELWPEDGGAEEFLMNLVDEDWAIGEGIDMELDH